MSWVVAFAWGTSTQRISYFYETEADAQTAYRALADGIAWACDLSARSTTLGGTPHHVEFKNKGAMITVRADLIGEVLMYEDQWALDIGEEQSRFYGRIDIVNEEARKAGRRDAGETEVGFKP